MRASGPRWWLRRSAFRCLPVQSVGPLARPYSRLTLSGGGLVRAKGLEPPHLSILVPKTSASTSSATPAWMKPETQGTCPYKHARRSEEHTSELQSLMRISYAVFCLKKKKKNKINNKIKH